MKFQGVILLGFDNVNILTVLVFWSMSHDAFPFFMFSSISYNFLQLSLYRSFTSLIKFISRYFLAFGALVNGIVFFFRCLIIVHSNETEFYIARLGILILFLIREKAFKCSLLSITLVLGFLYMFFITLRYVPSHPTC